MKRFSEKEIHNRLCPITENEEDLALSLFLTDSEPPNLRRWFFELFESVLKGENEQTDVCTDSVNLELLQDKVIISQLYPPDENNPPPVSEISYEELKEIMNEWNECLEEWKKNRIVEKSPQTFFESVKDWLFG